MKRDLQAFVRIGAGIALTCCGAGRLQAAGHAEVIYGDDNRRDLYATDNDPAMVEAARSTAMLTYAASLKPDTEAGYSRLPPDKFSASFNLCESEPFRDQPNPAFCSGFLVGDDILVTAGHCVETQANCNDTAFVFGFGYDSADRDVTKVSDLDVYRCKRLVAQTLGSASQTDYAVVQLDRKVMGRTPLKFRREGRIEVGAPVTVIGHPSGLPTKISGGANVRNSSSDAFFVANLDTYGGNSGSAVFNSATHEVEGILVRGESDFVDHGGCQISNVCTNADCRGEDSTRATEFAPFVPDPSQPQRPTQSHVHELADLSLAIPDNDAAGVGQDIVVSEAGLLADLSVHVKLTHTYVGDLTIQLVHPDGTAITLQQQGGGGQHDLDQVYGVDGLSVPALLQLRDKPAAGTWKLLIKDTAAQDVGTLTYVALTTLVYVD